MKTPETITVGAVCDKQLIDRLDAIAAKHMRSRAKEITIAIMTHVQNKESALPSDHIPGAGKMVTAAIMNEQQEKKA